MYKTIKDFKNIINKFRETRHCDKKPQRNTKENTITTEVDKIYINII